MRPTSRARQAPELPHASSGGPPPFGDLPCRTEPQTLPMAVECGLEAQSGPPPLPPLSSLPCPSHRGPTPWCNWVIKPCLLAGAYPASTDDHETARILETLLELGVSTFVCLQAEVSLSTPESAWRAGQGLRPYIRDAQAVLVRARAAGSRRILQDKLHVLHLPILDGCVASDAALSRLADDCCARILRGDRLYVHCWGGHGRTGTLVAVMLGRLYGLAGGTALRYTQAFHDSRRYPQGVRSPQTAPQVAQVRRLLADVAPAQAGIRGAEAAPAVPLEVHPEVSSKVSSCGTAETQTADTDGGEPGVLPALGQYGDLLAGEQPPRQRWQQEAACSPASCAPDDARSTAPQWETSHGTASIANAVHVQAELLRRFMHSHRAPGTAGPETPPAPRGTAAAPPPPAAAGPNLSIMARSAVKPAAAAGVVRLSARAGPTEPGTRGLDARESEGEGHGIPDPVRGVVDLGGGEVEELRPSRVTVTLPPPDSAPAGGKTPRSLLSFLPVLWG